MTPERWARIQEVFAAALERAGDARGAFLAGECRGDAELRAEVDALLLADEEASEYLFVVTPGAEDPRRPRLSAGMRLGTYEIVEPIGAGGMGEVYRARDRKLERDVAIKVLPTHLSDSRQALARFEREAKAVAALSHPNILSIFDYGSQGDVSYTVTELLEGETLSEKLAAGPVSTRQAIDYALQIVKGLAAAHEKGVVHRDLKPDNVFVGKDGHVKILDFGLAKRQEKTTTGVTTNAPTASGHTEPGTVMGTVGYMSPEQVRGLPLDHRSDLFSFGAILYEMLSGQRAFRRETPADTMSAIIRDEPPEPTGSGRKIPPALHQVIRHCLEKDRDRRLQSAHDIALALSEAWSRSSAAVVPFPARARRPAIAAVLLAVLAAVGFLLWRSSGAPTFVASGAVKRIAVLPFENQGPPEDDYFADGMADEIRSKLTALQGVEVIARASSTEYRKSPKTPRQIADELGVRYLLMATVRWQKGDGAARVHVTPELVEVSESGAPASKWEQPFDAALTDVFQVQSDIATKVADALGVALAEGQKKQLSERPTANLAAYDAFLKGEETQNGSGMSSTRNALEYYEQAVALDPSFALAWARLSTTCSALVITSPTPQLAERARQAAEKAVALAPDHPEGYRALGNYRSMVLLDYPGAHEQYVKAQQMAPANADLLGRVAAADVFLGRWESGLKTYAEALHLDPRSRATLLRLGHTLVWLRRYPEAREVLDRGLALSPSSLTFIQHKVLTFLGEGNLAAARALLETVPKGVEPTAVVSYFAANLDLVWVLNEEQRDLLTRLTPTAFDNDAAIWGLCLAQAHALKGDVASVRAYAEKARRGYEEHVRQAPNDDELRMGLGLSLAYLGRKEEAILEGERGLQLGLASKNVLSGSYDRHQLVRIYMLVGEPEKALDQLEPLLKIPYYLSPGWLKIDPNFDPLRNNPRFQKLVAGK